MTRVTNTKSPARILVVDDDANLAAFVLEILSDAGHESTSVGNARDAMERMEAEPFDLVITDMRMPAMSGLDLVSWTKKYDPRIAILAVTAYGSIETAVQVVRAGAADYITKPFEADALLLVVDRCLRERELLLEVTRLRTEVDQRVGFDGMVARSPTMIEIVSLAQRIADSPSSVLITGPTGSGKEVLARAIHQSSRRRARPFVAINCAAIPDQLLESELFGHRRGAFTGAVADKVGLFQAAHGGTIFLDEIRDLPLALQAKLLRVLQEREVRPVGATASEPIDVRVLAATHSDLRQAIVEHAFREDLFYRLCVIEIALPALADRSEDVVPMAEHFLLEANRRLARQIQGFSGAAKRLLCTYSWPGNVRELQNAVERAVNLCDGDMVTPEELPAALRRPREEDFLDRAVEQRWTITDLEVAYARRVFTQTGGNKKRAAQWLGIDRRTLRRWLGEPDETSDE